eukprot:765966-Hanusia_phi.AAC.15
MSKSASGEERKGRCGRKRRAGGSNDSSSSKNIHQLLRLREEKKIEICGETIALEEVKISREFVGMEKKQAASVEQMDGCMIIVDVSRFLHPVSTSVLAVHLPAALLSSSAPPPLFFLSTPAVSSLFTDLSLSPPDLFAIPPVLLVNFLHCITIVSSYLPCLLSSSLQLPSYLLIRRPWTKKRSKNRLQGISSVTFRSSRRLHRQDNKHKKFNPSLVCAVYKPFQRLLKSVSQALSHLPQQIVPGDSIAVGFDIINGNAEVSDPSAVNSHTCLLFSSLLLSCFLVHLVSLLPLLHSPSPTPHCLGAEQGLHNGAVEQVGGGYHSRDREQALRLENDRDARGAGTAPSFASPTSSSAHLLLRHRHHLPLLPPRLTFFSGRSYGGDTEPRQGLAPCANRDLPALHSRHVRGGEEAAAMSKDRTGQ